MKSVLIIDDAMFMRLSLKTMLEKNGFQVIGEASTGIEGITQFMKLSPDIVTMDITMPEMNGVEALKEILKINNKAVVVMVSAMGQENRVMEAIMFGARGFIVKPVTEEALINAMNKF